MTRRRARIARRSRRISSLVVTLVVLSCGVALAWTSATTNPGNALTAATLGSATNPNGTKLAGAATTCTTVTVTWTASSAPVNTYIVQAMTANGAWTTINGDTGNVTTIPDATLYTQRDVTYRVAGEYTNGTLTNWMSAYASDPSPLLCGTVGEVDDLAVAPNTCVTSVVLTWTAPSGAPTTYDRQYSINGGTTWTAAGTNLAGLTWTDAVVHPAGSTVLYQVRPGDAGGNDGNWSNIATVPDWGFYASSIAIGDGDGILEPGDTIAVTFNRAITPTTPSGTNATSIHIRTTGAKGLTISAIATGATNSGIGFIPTTTAMGTTTAAYAGSIGVSVGNTVWTWTKGAGANVASTTTPGYGAYAVGSSTTNPVRVKCSDTTTVALAYAPTITGSF